MIIQRSLKKALKNPAAVTGLDFRQEKPERLPDMQAFVNLEFIDLSNCSSLDWKDACLKLANLPKLTEIKAFNADIQALPDEFGLLSNLKKIDFAGNATLTSLPETVHKLIALEDISFHGCGLQSLPETTWHFPQLHTLTLSQNKITTIPQHFFDDLPELMHLFIDENSMTSLPDSICQLQSLKLLYAGGNLFRELPANFSLLTILETLWLDSCPGLDFEKELRKGVDMPLKNLTLLGNNLSVLPAAFRDLTSVEILNINSNKIYDTVGLLESLSHLPLKELDIRFMTNTMVSLEVARTYIPTLQQIYCDTRRPTEYGNDVYEWVASQLNLDLSSELPYTTNVAEFLTLSSGEKTTLEYGNYPDTSVPTVLYVQTEYMGKIYRASIAINNIQTHIVYHQSVDYLGIEGGLETIATISLGEITYRENIDFQSHYPLINAEGVC